MDRLDSIRVQLRPLNDLELADLIRQASEAEGRVREAQGKSWRRTLRLGTAAALIYAGLWFATLRLNLDLNRTIVSTAASLVVVLGAAVWERREARARMDRVRQVWAETIAGAREHPVAQIDVAPLRAWGSEQGWIFDLGGGRALFAEWDIPANQPQALICWRHAWGGVQWLEQSGGPIPVQPLVLDWNRFPSSHPLAESFGPALVTMGEGADPASALLAFESGSLPLGRAE